jgi:thiamine pyrophosphokinase
MDALLAIGGEGPEADLLAPRFSAFGSICAADSGLDLLRAWGLEPDLIVGDMDSLSDLSLLEAYPKAQVLRFPRAKDESDTELALRILRERGASRIVLAGGGEGRLDHLLAIRALFERPFPPSEWHTARESLFHVAEGESLELATRRGEVISVFPLSGGASKMLSRGLAWPLEGLVWDAGGFGLSNESLGETVGIKAGKGDLLVIRNREAKTPL